MPVQPSRAPRAFAAPALAIGLGVAACGAPPSERVGETRSAIVNGSPSDSSQDFAVHVVLANYANACTGTLVAPDLVMTAQHCVVSGFIISGGENDITTCLLSATPLPLSGFEAVDFGPDIKNPTLSVPVAKVFVDESNTDCTKDVAFLQLQSPVTSVTVHPLLLDSTIGLGEPITQIGWGDVNDEFANPTGRLQQSGTITMTPDGKGSAVTPGGSDITNEIPRGFLVANITSCDGDSGSPWLDSSGNVVGIFDQILSDQTIGSGPSRQSKCSDSVSLATPLQNVVPFLEQVFEADGLMPWRAGRSAPPGDVGTSCDVGTDGAGVNNECNSNFCVTVGSTGYCSMPCASTSCPSSTVCTDTGASTPVCLPPSASPTPRGCSLATSHDAGWAPAACFLGLIAGRALRRRRSARAGSDARGRRTWRAR